MKKIERYLSTWIACALALGSVTGAAGADEANGRNQIASFWQCVGECMPICQGSRNGSYESVSPTGTCESFCKTQCNPNTPPSYTIEAFLLSPVIPYGEISSFEIRTDTEVKGSVSCGGLSPFCKCSGVDTCNDFIATCAANDGSPVCTDEDSEGRPTRCICY